MCQIFPTNNGNLSLQDGRNPVPAGGPASPVHGATGWRGRCLGSPFAGSVVQLGCCAAEIQVCLLVSL